MLPQQLHPSLELSAIPSRPAAPAWWTLCGGLGSQWSHRLQCFQRRSGLRRADDHDWLLLRLLCQECLHNCKATRFASDGVAEHWGRRKRRRAPAAPAAQPQPQPQPQPAAPGHNQVQVQMDMCPLPLQITPRSTGRRKKKPLKLDDTRKPTDALEKLIKNVYVRQWRLECTHCSH